METETEFVCSMPFVAAFYGACFVTFVSLCLSLVGLCVVEFSRPPAWRFAIACGVFSVVVGLGVAMLFYDGPTGRFIPMVMTLVGVVFGALNILAGIVRRPGRTAGG